MRLPRKIVLAALPILVALPLTGCSLMIDGGERDFSDDARAIGWETAWDAAEGALSTVRGAADDLLTAGGDLLSAHRNVSDLMMGVPAALEAAFGVEGDADGSLAAKAGEVVVTDARSGARVAVVSDRMRLLTAMEGLDDADGWSVVGSNPGSDQREYEFSYRQDETVKLGQDPAHVQRREVLNVVTYRGSNCVTAKIAGFGPALDLEAPPAYAEALRELAR